MIRIINLRVAVTVKSDIKDIVEKKYPQLRGAIETIHVVRRAVDARKKPNMSLYILCLLRFITKLKL